MTDLSSYSERPDLGSLPARAWTLGIAAAAISLLGAWLDTPRFLQSYLVSWLMVTSVAFGCFGILCLQHLTHGAWGMMARRPLEAAVWTLPYLGLLFVPVLLRLSDLYLWARPEVVAEDEMLQHKATYLNEPGFIGRTVAYFLILILFSWLLQRLSNRQDEGDRPGLSRNIRRLAAPGLGIYVLVASFAAVDWIMSLEPHWYSSLFGVYFIGGQGVAGFAFVILAALYLSGRRPMADAFKAHHFHDYGKLLLAFVMLWAYFAISQLLIIWSGNITEEVTWYLHRTHGGWKVLSIILALFHFALPFLLLLSRDLKRNARLLAAVALLMLVMRWLDLYWQAAPVFHPEGLSFHWLDLTTLLALGGIWVGLFLRGLRRRPLLPVGDPDLGKALAAEGHHG